MILKKLKYASWMLIYDGQTFIDKTKKGCLKQLEDYVRGKNEKNN